MTKEFTMKTFAVIVAAVAILLALIVPSFAGGTTWKEIYSGACELNQSGNCADALAQAQVAAQEAAKRFGANSINVAKSLDLVAEITRAQGDRAGAAQIYNRSLAIQEKILGPSHPRVIKTMCALADLNAEQDRLFEARALYVKAKAAAEATDRAEGLDAVAPLVGLAKLDQACGNYVECRQLCQQILAICPKYVKYQPGLAGLIAGTIRQLNEVSALHEARVRQ